MCSRCHHTSGNSSTLSPNSGEFGYANTSKFGTAEYFIPSSSCQSFATNYGLAESINDENHRIMGNRRAGPFPARSHIGTSVPIRDVCFANSRSSAAESDATSPANTGYFLRNSPSSMRHGFHVHARSPRWHVYCTTLQSAAIRDCICPRSTRVGP
jgi:hypothetical protein